MNDHHAFEWLDAYALGTLDPGEAARVEAHLRECPACGREYDELRRVIDVLPQALPAQPAPAALRDRIMAAIDEPQHPAEAPHGADEGAQTAAFPPRAERRDVPVIGALAAALALALCGDAYLAFAHRFGDVAPAVREARAESAALIAALRTGKVYAVDGVVGTQPWHLTIVQPRNGDHALIFSGTPGAPAGDTYRTWVIRTGRTVDIGELPPEKPATLQMPMALEPGDIIAFSREPVGAGNLPTQPFLMQFTVPQ